MADFDPVELARGRLHEMEHTTDPRIAREIAADHLAEDPQYYQKLQRAGLGGGDMGDLGMMVGVALLGLAAVGGAVGYFAGGRRVWPVAVGAVGVPAAALLYSRIRARAEMANVMERQRQLDACIDAYCKRAGTCTQDQFGRWKHTTATAAACSWEKIMQAPT